MRDGSWWLTYNFTDEERLCVTPSRLNHVPTHKHVRREAFVSPIMAVRHYSGLFMSSDVVSRWDHELKATPSQTPNITFGVLHLEQLLGTSDLRAKGLIYMFEDLIKTGRARISVHLMHTFASNIAQKKIIYRDTHDTNQTGL